jgi:outer membrane receptor protein involved in Fe transport
VYEFTYSEQGIDFNDGAPVKPETIDTAEVEGRYHPAAGVTMVGAVFANRITDFIDDAGDFTVNSPDPLTTVGGELEARYEKNGQFFVSQYSVQRTRVGDLLTGDPLPNSPEHLAAVHWYLPIGDSGLGLANRVVVDLGRLDRDLAPTPPSAVWDATLTLNPGPFQVAVGVRNILDAQVLHPVGEGFVETTVEQDRRSLRLELKGSL